MDQHMGGKWLICGTKRHNDNQVQSLEVLCRLSSQVKDNQQLQVASQHNWLTQSYPIQDLTYPLCDSPGV